MRAFLFAVAVTSVAIVPLGARARWAEPAEASFAVNFETNRFKIRKDGTYAIEAARQVEILKDSARLDRGLSRISFDARASRFRLLEAKTINGKKTIKVDQRHVEIKPLASSGQGFDEIRQATIAFPEVNVGSKLFSRFVRDVREPAVPGFFAVSSPIGGEFTQRLELSFVSELPLFVETFDPEGYLEVESGRKGGLWTASIRLKKPILRMIVEENNVVYDPKSVPWIAVSTAKDWSAFPRAVFDAYEKQMSAPLPPAFEKILESARAKATDVEKIDATTSGLQGLLRYVGDWVPVKGAYFPRPLKEIAGTGFGDCKDFATSTAAILRRLGFDARAAWVSRGRSYPIAPTALAVPDFNHAIVYAVKDGPDGKTERWIDPTNVTSFARGIYADIADRPALALLPGGPLLKRVPPMRAGDGESRSKTRLVFGEGGQIAAEGEAALIGRAALPMTGASLSYSKQQIDYMLIGWVANPGNLASWSFENDEFKSRVASDWTSKFQYVERWRPLRTTVGPGYLIQMAPTAALLDFRREQRDSGVELNEPGLWRREQTIVGRAAILKKPIACAGESEWLGFSRRFEAGPGRGELTVVDEVLTKRGSIPAPDVKTPEFAKLQEALGACLREAAVVFAETGA